MHRVDAKHREDRFIEILRSITPDSNGCLVWPLGLGTAGYGHYKGFKKGRMITLTAHRYAWSIAHGEIPNGLFVCHRCDNKPCVNLEHLWLGTNRDNQKDASHKGLAAFGLRNGAYTHPERRPRGERNGSLLHPERLARGDKNGSRLYPERLAHGERNPSAKLDTGKVADIRRRYVLGERRKDIAALYGVSVPLIYKITVGKLWKGVWSMDGGPSSRQT